MESLDSTVIVANVGHCYQADAGKRPVGMQPDPEDVTAGETAPRLAAEGPSRVAPSALKPSAAVELKGTVTTP